MNDVKPVSSTRRWLVPALLLVGEEEVVDLLVVDLQIAHAVPRRHPRLGVRREDVVEHARQQPRASARSAGRGRAAVPEERVP